MSLMPAWTIEQVSNHLGHMARLDLKKIVIIILHLLSGHIVVLVENLTRKTMTGTFKR